MSRVATEAARGAASGHELSAILAVAQRDATTFLADRTRIVATFVLPFLLVLVLVLGSSFRGSIGSALGFDYPTFVFTGVYAQQLFQSAALGIVSLLEDRENDFTQELFIAPVSRYSIIVGKIAGESLAAMVQAVGIIGFGLVVGVPLSPARVAGLLVIGAAACLFGGSFGLLLRSTVRNRRVAEQLFNFIFLPQFLLAGVFNPIRGLPGCLKTLSRVAPMRYAVDLIRSVYDVGSPEGSRVVLDGFAVDAAVVAGLFTPFVVAGTTLFVRNERNR